MQKVSCLFYSLALSMFLVFGYLCVDQDNCASFAGIKFGSFY